MVVVEEIDENLEESVVEPETDILEDPKFNIDSGKILANLFAGRYKSKELWQEFERTGTNINLEGKVIQARANKEENVYINNKLFYTGKIERVKFEDNTSYDTYEKVLTKAVDLLNDKDFNASKGWLELAKKTLESQKVIWQKGVYANGKSVRRNKLIVKFNNKVTALHNEDAFDHVLKLVDEKIALYEFKVTVKQSTSALSEYPKVIHPIKEENETYKSRNGNNPLEKIINDSELNFWEKLYKVNEALIKEKATEKQASDVNGKLRKLVSDYKIERQASDPWTGEETKRIQTIQDLVARYIFYKKSGFLGGFQKYLCNGNRTQREYLSVDKQIFDLNSLNELGYNLPDTPQNNNGHKLGLRLVEKAKGLFGRITTYFSTKKAA